MCPNCKEKKKKLQREFKLYETLKNPHGRDLTNDPTVGKKETIVIHYETMRHRPMENQALLVLPLMELLWL